MYECILLIKTFQGQCSGDSLRLGCRWGSGAKNAGVKVY